LSWKGQLKRAHKRKRKQKKLLVKLQKVVQGRENILEDLAHANRVEVDLLDRNHPNPIGKLSRHRNTLSDRLCETCGKPHSGVCYRAIGACFNCGGTGHFAKDCVSPRYYGSFTMSEGLAQVSTPKSSPVVGRGRGRGKGNTPGSQSTVNQPE